MSDEKGSWRLSLAIAAGQLVIRALASTWRYRTVNEGGWRSLRARQQPFLFAFWHGQMLPLLWLHRHQGVVVLVSSHRDGEIIARIAERLGFRTVRGSSNRGAARALFGVVRELEAGREVAVTPDGPRGPVHRFASGTLIAAQRVGVPIVAVGVSARRTWRLRSWDRFMIPKPFARVSVAYSTPTPVAAASPREAEAEAPAFEGLVANTIAAADGA